MKNYSKSLITIAIATIFGISACSSSNKTSALENEASTPDDQVTGTSGSPVIVDNPVTTASFTLDENGFGLIEKLGGYQLESLSEEVALIGDLATTSAIGQSVIESAGFSVEDRGSTIPVQYDTQRYDCAQGGQVIVKKSELELFDSSYSRILESVDYSFDQCQVSMNGEHLLNGELSLFGDSVSASRATSQNASVSWNGFSWQQPSGLTVSINANSVTDLFDSNDQRSSRVTTIDQYQTDQDGQIIEQISNGTFTRVDQSEASGSVQEYTLRANGRIQDASGVVINIETNPEMNRKLVFNDLSIEPVDFNGVISLSADNNAELTYTAIPSPEFDNLLVDVVYRDSAGGTSTKQAQKLINLVTIVR